VRSFECIECGRAHSTERGAERCAVECANAVVVCAACAREFLSERAMTAHVCDAVELVVCRGCCRESRGDVAGRAHARRCLKAANKGSLGFPHAWGLNGWLLDEIARERVAEVVDNLTESDCSRWLVVAGESVTVCDRAPTSIATATTVVAVRSICQHC
jgi:hypothetical protein